MKNLKTFFVGASLLTAFGVYADGSVKVELPAGNLPSEAIVTYSKISDVLNARRGQEVESWSDTIAIAGPSFSFAIEAPEWAGYEVDFGEGRKAEFFARPGDMLTMSVTEVAPQGFTYRMTGSEMVEQAAALDELLNPILTEYMVLRNTPGADPAQGEVIIDRYNAAAEGYIRSNPGSIAAPYALVNYDGDNYPELFAMLTGNALQSPFYGAAEKKNERVKVAMEKEKLQKELQSGSVDAPDFTLKNLNGEPVSLSSLRGKFVVIDFWGSWCIWCIKGFPALKEAYADGKGGFEVLGVDCQDTEEKWRAAVAKYELPWLNVYNPQDSGILDKYGVSGFPTKVIVNPEGKIVNITVGEDPAFFDTLNRLMGK